MKDYEPWKNISDKDECIVKKKKERVYNGAKSI